MIKQFCQIGLLFLRSIGLIETIGYKIGFDENKDIGLVQIRQRNTHKQLQICGLDEIG